MLDELEQQVLEFLQSQGLLNRRTNVLVAVSGGADSVALLTVLAALVHSRAADLRIVVGHVNHRLRGAASDGDEEFVRDLAAALEFDFHATSVDVPQAASNNKLSIETAARVLRINALIEMAARSGCKIVATAHHMDDNAETIVHRLLRGAGIRGLAGIRPSRTLLPAVIPDTRTGPRPQSKPVTFVSPLLSTTRRRIIEYCTARHIPWRHDHTNDDRTHTRNRIRHLLLPALQRDAASDLVAQLNALSANCRGLLSQIERRAEDLSPSVFKETSDSRVVMDREIIAAQPDLVAVEILRCAISRAGIGLRNISEPRYLALLRQARRGSPRRLSLPGSMTASVQGGCLSLERTKPPDENTSAEPRPLAVGGTTLFGPYKVETALLEAPAHDLEKFLAAKDRFTEWFDCDKIVPPLCIRPRRTGDRFQPLGKTTEIKVGKFISAARIDAEARSRIVVFADSEKIIWVAPIRPSELTRLTPSTTRVLQIRIVT